MLEIEGELEASVFESYRTHALKHLNETMKLDGFRPGHIPESVLVQKVGEVAILEEMANEALGKAYQEIVREHKLEVIGRPKVNITKIARNNPLGFKIETAILPKITLPDYKKIAGETKKELTKDKLEVSEKEVLATLEDIRKSRAKKRDQAKTVSDTISPLEEPGASGSLASDPELEARLPSQEPSNQNTATPGKASPSTKSPEEELPALDDDFARSLGKFEHLADLKEKLHANILMEKELERGRALRNAIVERIVQEVAVVPPKLLLDRELARMFEELKQSLAESGLTYEAYLAGVKKTEDDIRKEWAEVAKKRVLSQLVLRAIGSTEAITVPPEAVQQEVEKLITMYPAASRDAAELYIEEQLTIEHILQKLENFWM